MKRKKAFTLAEMLLVLGILGILMAIAVTVMKPQDASRKAMISSTLTILDKAVYSAYANKQEGENPFSDYDNSGTKNNQNPRVLCNALVSYINTIEDRCNETNFIKNFTEDTIFKGDDNRTKYLAFITGTGTHVFISESITDTDGNVFYLIFADINGEKAPNTPVYKAGSGLKPVSYPDIYTFAVIPLGRIIPIGILENDIKLLTAKPNQIRNKNSIEIIGNSTTYARAKSQAWGFYTSKKKVKGKSIETDITMHGDTNDVSMLEEPYAYNDHIRKLINNDNTVFYKNIPSLNNVEEFRCCKDFNADGACTAFLDDEFYDGSCSIEIDTYSY